MSIPLAPIKIPYSRLSGDGSSFYTSHRFTRQFSCVRFLPKSTQIVNLTVTTIWARFTWRVFLVCVRFLQPWYASCNVVLTLCF